MERFKNCSKYEGSATLFDFLDWGTMYIDMESENAASAGFMFNWLFVFPTSAKDLAGLIGHLQRFLVIANRVGDC